MYRACSPSLETAVGCADYFDLGLFKTSRPRFRLGFPTAPGTGVGFGKGPHTNGHDPTAIESDVEQTILLLFKQSAFLTIWSMQHAYLAPAAFRAGGRRLHRLG